MATKFCIKCGKQLSADTVFCPYCGTKQPDVPADAEPQGEPSHGMNQGAHLAQNNEVFGAAPAQGPTTQPMATDTAKPNAGQVRSHYAQADAGPTPTDGAGQLSSVTGPTAAIPVEGWQPYNQYWGTPNGRYFYRLVTTDLRKLDRCVGRADYWSATLGVSLIAMILELIPVFSVLVGIVLAFLDGSMTFRRGHDANLPEGQNKAIAVALIVVDIISGLSAVLIMIGIISLILDLYVGLKATDWEAPYPRPIGIQ